MFDGGVCLKKSEPILRKIPKTETDSVLPKQFFWGKGFGKTSAVFPPAGGVWGGMRAGFGLGISDFKKSPPDFVPMKLARRRIKVFSVD